MTEIQLPLFSFPDDDVRTCTLCLIPKPATLEFFCKKNGGLDTRCKDCKYTYKHQWDNANREYTRLKQRAYHAKNMDVNNERARTYRKERPEVVKKTSRQTYLKHREVRIADAQAYRQAHPEQERQRYARNPSRNRAQNALRRARKQGSNGVVTTQDIQAQYATQQGCCMWCSEFVGTVYDVDHVKPLARDGTHTPDNIVIACPTCNGKKGAKLVYVEWQPPKPLINTTH